MKCYLVVLEGQFGTAYQIWYDNDGAFIGCGGMEPVVKHLLPDPKDYGLERWSTTEAMEYYKSLQE